eukprot:6203315-Pleurochrysis_carterae.AAC.1
MRSYAPQRSARSCEISRIIVFLKLLSRCITLGATVVAAALLEVILVVIKLPTLNHVGRANTTASDDTTTALALPSLCGLNVGRIPVVCSGHPFWKVILVVSQLTSRSLALALWRRVRCRTWILPTITLFALALGVTDAQILVVQPPRPVTILLAVEIFHRRP